MRNQKTVNAESPASAITFDKNDASKNVDHESGKELPVSKSPEKLSRESAGRNESNGDENVNSVRTEGNRNVEHDVADLLRKAYRIFLEDSIVATVAGTFTSNIYFDTL